MDNRQRSGKTSVGQSEASSKAVADMISNMYRGRVFDANGRSHTHINSTVTSNAYIRPFSAAQIAPFGSRNAINDNVNQPLQSVLRNVDDGKVNWPPRRNPFRNVSRSSGVATSHWKKENDPPSVGFVASPTTITVRPSQPVKRPMPVSSRVTFRQREFRKYASGDRSAVGSFGSSNRSFRSFKKPIGLLGQSHSAGKLCACNPF